MLKEGKLPEGKLIPLSKCIKLSSLNVQHAAQTGKTCVCLPDFSFTFTFSRTHSFGEYMNRYKHMTLIMLKWMGFKVSETSIKCII